MYRNVSKDTHYLFVFFNMMHHPYDTVNMQKSSIVLWIETQNLLDLSFNFYELL